MPITYRIDHDPRRILTRCEGETTLPEVLSHFAELEADPDCPPGADVLLDLSAQSTIPNVGQIRAAADRTRQAARRVRFGSCAIVVSSETMFGMARVFETFTETIFTRTRVFRSHDAAEAWLKEPGTH